MPFRLYLLALEKYYHQYWWSDSVSIQSVSRRQHAIGIGIDPITRCDRDPGDANPGMQGAGALLGTFSRIGRQCAHADVAAIDLDRITDAAVDDDAGPAILFGQLCQIATEQSAAQAAAAVHHQHLTLPRLFQ